MNHDLKSYAVRKIKSATIFWAILLAGTILLANFLPQVVTVSNTAGEEELPIQCVDMNEKKVSLTFDAAWGNENTEKILEILSEKDVKATFFLTGVWIETFPKEVMSIVAAGHDLGNHSANHRSMSLISQEEKTKEIMAVHNKVKELAGYEMNLFRPPYGDFNGELVSTAKENGYHTIQWDVDSLDWKDYGADSIVQTVIQNENFGNGSIIRCHNDAKYIAEALDELITKLMDQGYEIVPVSELIYQEDYHIDNKGKQILN